MRGAIYVIRDREAWDAMVARCEGLAAGTGWPACLWWRKGTGAVRLVCGMAAAAPLPGWHLAWEAGMPAALAGAAWEAYQARTTGGGEALEPGADPVGRTPRAGVEYGEDAEII